MESNVKHPVWKMLIGYIVIIIMIILIALLSSCGTRKAETEINKVSVDNRSDKALESSKQSESSDKSESQLNKTNDKVKENSETTTTTKYGPDGKPTETSTTTKQSKSVDKSVTTHKRTRELKTRYVENLKTRDIHRNSYREIIKTKSVSSNRDGLYYSLAAVGVICALIAGALKWFKKF